MRLKEGFYEGDELLVLEAMPDGYLYSNILIKLYLKSLKNNGKLMFNERIPFNAQLIATVTRHQVGTVERALKVFQELGLIEVLDNGAIYMLDIQSYIGKSSTEADRKREYRREISTQKQLIGQMSDKHSREIEKEIDLDIELEEEKEIKNKETFVSLIDDYTTEPLLISALKNYVEMRKKMKGFTTHALKINLNTLSKLTNDDTTKVAIVEQSIEHSWKSFYELKHSVMKETKEKPLPSWYTETTEAGSTKEDHLEKLKMQYSIYSKYGPEDKLENIKSLYKDLTGRNIEDDIEGEKNE